MAPTIATQSPSNDHQLRPITDLPLNFRQIFAGSFENFNKIQSQLFDDFITNDKSLVICSPTGSGKTVLLELAIVRELIKLEQAQSSTTINPFKNLHVLYFAPLKAIVEEKCSEWQKKFDSLGLKCSLLTGDVDLSDFNSIQDYLDANIILATPEKFDYILRTDSKSGRLLSRLQLVMIDEIHTLGEKSRGKVLEATITRIKSLRYQQTHKNPFSTGIRFVAISATVPNVEDIANWLDKENSEGIVISEDLRPVKLEKTVLGFEVNKFSANEFKFEIQLSYHLENVIRTYSERKPCLVFCSTRKQVESSAKILSSARNTYFASPGQRTKLFEELLTLTDQNFDYHNPVDNEGYFKNMDLKTSISSGVAFYHAGLQYSDRRLLERLFALSLIPVMVSTSSLAMGVNLPAHLVIIKNTVQFLQGSTVEYDTSQILQMIGRAGRPQFDTSAKAIIMTRKEKKSKYESLMNSQQVVESQMHRHLAEQLTIEIVLRSVTKFDFAIDWLQSTFMFIRIMRNPLSYTTEIQETGNYEEAYAFIRNWCMKAINKLYNLGIINIKDDNESFDSTYLARIVIRNSISLAATKMLIETIKEPYNLKRLLELLCKTKEVNEDVILRTNEKKHLNELNKSLRFAHKDKIKTPLMKINCLLQATFDNLNIESSLVQDATNAIRNGQRVTKCFVEICLYFWTLHRNIDPNQLRIPQLDMCFETVLSAIQLMKAFRSKLWHDSKLVAKQLNKIGTVFSTTLLQNEYDSFEKLLQANPRDLEFLLKRHPPFGSYVIEEIKSLPKYILELKPSKDTHDLSYLQCDDQILATFPFKLELDISRYGRFPNLDKSLLKPNSHFVILIVGCQECDKIILFQRFSDSDLQSIEKFSKDIILVQTSFKMISIIEEDAENQNSDLNLLFNHSSQAAANKPKSKSTKGAKKSKATEEPVRVKRTDSEEFVKFSNYIESFKTTESQEAYHCMYANQKNHTIQALVISESFVGIDVSVQLPIEMNNRSVISIGKPANQSKPWEQANHLNEARSSRLVQTKIRIEKNKMTFSTKSDKSSEISAAYSASLMDNDFNFSDDEDLMEMCLEDYDEKALINDHSEAETVKGNEDDSELQIMSDIGSSELDAIVPSQPCYSQFEDKEYIQTTQQTPSSNPVTTTIIPSSSQEWNLTSYELDQENNDIDMSQLPQPNLRDKMKQYRLELKAQQPSAEEKRHYTKSLLSSLNSSTQFEKQNSSLKNHSYYSQQSNNSEQQNSNHNNFNRSFSQSKPSESNVSKYFANRK